MNQEKKKEEFQSKILSIYTGAVLTNLIEIGYQTGLFEESAKTPITSKELSDRLHLSERYVREWLNAMATADIYLYDGESKKYTLPPEHALFLTGKSSNNCCPHSKMLGSFGKLLPKLTECFQKGGGIPYSDFRPEFTDCMDDVWRRIFDELLDEGFIGTVKGLRENLKKGLRVLDIGCGTGHAVNILARKYPRSVFRGYDIADDAIERANIEARSMNLANASFEVLDIAKLPPDPKFELITAFDAIHDQKEPFKVLKNVRNILAEDGIFLMIEFKFSSDVKNNIGNPLSPLYYGISLLHCMTVSLASGGPGLGAVWGTENALQMLSDAGFSNVDLVDAPRPQNCIYICRK